MIYTSYFANMSKLPKELFCISICAAPPKGYKGTQYKILAPSYSILMDYKAGGDKETYIKRYTEEILSRLNAKQIAHTLEVLSRHSKDICLLCYEVPEDFCHRHLVADWLNKNGIPCEELIIK